MLYRRNVKIFVISIFVIFNSCKNQNEEICKSCMSTAEQNKIMSFENGVIEKSHIWTLKEVSNNYKLACLFKANEANFKKLEEYFSKIGNIPESPDQLTRAFVVG